MPWTFLYDFLAGQVLEATSSLDQQEVQVLAVGKGSEVVSLFDQSLQLSKVHL